MKKRYYVLIFLMILIEWLPLIMVFFNTSIKTDYMIVNFVLLGWIIFICILISCGIIKKRKGKRKFIMIEKKGQKIMKNKKYVVICYAIHDKIIASIDTFEKETDAWEYLQKDATNTYEEERNNANEKDKSTVELDIDDYSQTAILRSYNDEYQWTWEIIEVEM